MKHAATKLAYLVAQFVVVIRLFPFTSSNAVVSKPDQQKKTVQCFCTGSECREPLCDGSWCLVGFKDDVHFVQRCATEQAKPLVNCARKLNGWEEVCSCDSDFCNTFSYMRETLKKYDDFRYAHPNVPDQFHGFDTSNLVDADAKQVDRKSITSPTQHLVFLLVVVPLGIGAVTVCLVFLNYHCKMC